MPPDTVENDGQMLKRVANDLLGFAGKNGGVVVLNDEAHHCYREKPDSDEELGADEREEAKKNSEAARLWIAGLEAVKRKLGITALFDLSATPFFLRGSGYREGTLFPWTVSDFSLMDAIECGIVKLPRIPVSDNLPTARGPDLSAICGTISARTCRNPDGQRRQRQSARPAEQAADRALCPLRALRKDVRGMVARRHRRAAGLHRGLQQHFDFGTCLRMDFRLRAGRRGRAEPFHRRPPEAVPQLRRARRPPRPAEHAADRQRADRFRRGARPRPSAPPSRPKSSSSAGRRCSAKAPAQAPRRFRTPISCARS